MTDIAPPDSSVWVNAVGEAGYQLIYDIYTTLGSGSDVIAEIQGINTFETTTIVARLGALKKHVDDLESLLLTTSKTNQMLIIEVKKQMEIIDYLITQNNALMAKVSGLMSNIDDIEAMAYVIN